MPESTSPQEKPKLSWLAGISTVVLTGAGVMTILCICMENHPIEKSLARATCVLWALVPILAALALMGIARSGGTLCGKKRATVAIVVSTGALFFVAIGVGGANIAYPMLCYENMKGVSNALLVYGMDNDDHLPDVYRWCDLLVAGADISPLSFKCPASDAHFGEASFAINSAVADMKLSDLPKDIVVAFEALPPKEPDRTFPVSSRLFAVDPNTRSHYGTGLRARGLVDKKRWNLVGSPADVDTDIHHGGCNIMFGDHHVEFVRVERLPSLRWTLDGKRPPPQTWSRIAKMGLTAEYVAFFAIGLLMLASAILLLVRCRLRRWGLIVTTVILSGLAGYFCGLISEPVHIQQVADVPEFSGGLAGAISGLWAGVCYGLLVGSTAGEVGPRRDIRLYIVALGVITGVIASIFFNATMMVAHVEAQGGLPIIAGIPFGVVAGAILGTIAAAIIGRNLKTTAETTNA